MHLNPGSVSIPKNGSPNSYMARENGLTYGKLIAGLKAKNIELDRKILAELAVSEPKAFAKIVESVK
jgi:ribosomal protein L20